MNPHCKYEVQTHWGWFRLDEGAYQDYLKGRLWITWEPGRPMPPQTASDAPPIRISREAKLLLERAERDGAPAVLRGFDPALNAPMPCTERMKELSIEELPLSVRAANGLHRAGIHTFGRLQEVSDSEPGLFSIRNLGRKSVLEIRSAFVSECYRRLLPCEKGAYWQRVQDAFFESGSHAENERI